MEQVNINVTKVEREVTINATPNVTQILVNTNTGGGGVQSVVAGTNISVDNTDPANPIISASGGGGTQNLNQVLVEGNATDGENIFISNGDEITFDNGSRIRKGLTDANNGGAKGVALVCSLDYELKWEAGRQYVMQQDGFTIREVSHNFTITPTATDDSTKGFAIDSRWILDNDDIYVCTDATEDSAVWELQVTQVNSDWNATSGVAEILNKPTIPDVTGFVPYTGANQNVNLGEFELKAGQIELDTTPTGTAGVAVTRWNDTIGSSETTLKGGNVILKNGVDLVARIVNKVTPNTTLTKASYQVVRISGAQGQRLAVNLAQANNDNNSADTLGVVCETIATNQEGFIMTVGQLENINTTGSLQGETWSDGDVLYLSPTTAGRLTNVKPIAPSHIVIVGYVEYAHANNGKIYVKIMNGWELDELHNVAISTPLNNQGLIYETSTDLWKNKTIIEDSITNGVTTIAPSQNSVFDAFNNLNPLVKRRYFDDLQGFGTAGTGSILGTTGTLEFEGNILLNRNGTGVSWTRTPAESGHSGIIRGGTGTTSTGLNLIQFRSIWLGTEDFESETSVRIQTLSDATNRFTLTFVNGVGTTNSIRFFYSDNVNSGKWQCETYSSSVSTLVDSGISVSINTWYSLKVVRISMVCYFYINGTLVATISTNIPSSFESFCTIGITKTVGTTSRTCDFDYLKFFDL
jgi:nitrogen fixation protein